MTEDPTKTQGQLSLKSEQVLSAIFLSSAEGIVIVNSRGTIVMVNPSAETLFGYEKNEMLGLPLETLVPRKYKQSHVKHRQAFQKEPQVRRMGMSRDLTGLRKDGTEFYLEISLNNATIKDQNYIVSFITDISERKRTESKIHSYTKQLERSNQELEDFAYISSHDLQEPLRKIRAFGDRLKNKEHDQLSEQGKDYMDRILSSAERMQHLINDLLIYSRITSKARPFEEVDLQKIIGESLADLELAIEKSKADIKLSKLPIIEADPTQLRQLFMNLIGNAIKFSQPGQPPIVHIAYNTSETTTDEVEITVTDNGIGFDEKYSGRIFHIFQRLEGRKYEGSGIGLAICKKIVQRHGGQITVKSQPGKGTTFYITLPRHPKPDPQLILEDIPHG